LVGLPVGVLGVALSVKLFIRLLRLLQGCIGVSNLSAALFYYLLVWLLVRVLGIALSVTLTWGLLPRLLVRVLGISLPVTLPWALLLVWILGITLSITLPWGLLTRLHSFRPVHQRCIGIFAHTRVFILATVLLVLTTVRVSITALPVSYYLLGGRFKIACGWIWFCSWLIYIELVVINRGLPWPVIYIYGQMLKFRMGHVFNVANIGSPVVHGRGGMPVYGNAVGIYIINYGSVIYNCSIIPYHIIIDI
jgi:hypothetical protein